MMIYGYQVDDGDNEDPLVELVDRSMKAWAITSTPGSFLVDTIPARMCSKSMWYDKITHLLRMYSATGAWLVSWH